MTPKSKLIFSLLYTSILSVTSCKKDNNQSTPPARFANSPTCAYFNQEPTGGGEWAWFLTFMDLRSTDITEKKYFKAQLKFRGIDSFEVVGTPQSVNSIATNFPSDITVAPGYGVVNQWTNPQYRLLTGGGGSYYKDTIVRNPASNIYHLYLNYLSGPLQGEWPQSNLDGYHVPAGINGQTTTHFRTIFYFKKGLCLDANNVDPSITIKPLSSFFTGAPNIYDWQHVDAAFLLPNTPVVVNNPCTFFFIDFKNWRFFKWEQFMTNIFSPAQLATNFGDYQNLDKLLKWPEGWGRP
jgi:hypothetical protein